MALKEERLKSRSSSSLLTIEEAANRLSVSIRNIRHQIYLRKLPIVKVGRLVRIDEHDLEEFIEQGRIRWDLTERR